ncbi:hypothetical protein PanWU01x14_246510 [Parasponia andersonii]|uniref:RNase H type-1 domain-containing protein n=1 Tax=Parasponia andersonii TaxID=3476 RepID=A0A2P5BEC4_PARAD|nr:hypothetical protein PanWU01x14_246510 [Parasponia andersonii]
MDATLSKDGNFIGIGVIIQDLRGALSRRLLGASSVFLAECVAIKEELLFAIQHNLPLKDVESDSMNVVLVITTSQPLTV